MSVTNRFMHSRKLVYGTLISVTILCIYQVYFQYSPRMPKSDFYIVAAYFNPIGYESRVRLHKDFERHMNQFGVPMMVVELAYQNQTFQVTDANNPLHIQLRTDVMLWYKENLLNIAFKKLPEHCKYVAWMDADITFTNKNWVQEAKEALRSYKIVQLFQFAYFLGPEGQPLRIDPGFGYYYATNKPEQNFTPFKLFEPNGTEIYAGDTKNGTVCYWHPGFGWVTEKETLRKMNGLCEVGIMGCNDNFVIFSLVDQPEKGMQKNINKEYKDEIVKWGSVATKVVQRKVGYIRGNVSHMWHGSFADRKYAQRENILFNGPEPYDPKRHLYHDNDGLLRLSPGYKEYLSNAMLGYLKDRNEDSVAVNDLRGKKSF